MFRKIIILALLVSVLSIASSVSVLAQAKSSDDENQTVAIKTEPKNEKLREVFLKKENQPNFVEKDNLAKHQKQQTQGKKLSKGTKIMIGVGVGVGVAILVGILTTRFGINE